MTIPVQEERERILLFISFCSILTLKGLGHTAYKREGEFLYSSLLIKRLLIWLSGKEAACHAEDMVLILGLGRSPGEGNGNLLQYSCLENSLDSEPGGLQYRGWQRVGRDWVHVHTLTLKCRLISSRNTLRDTSRNHPEIVYQLYLGISLPNNINNKINYFRFKHVWRGCCLVPQSCTTLCDPMGSSPPGSSVHRISQKRILEWVVIYFSRASSWFRDQTLVSCLAGGFFNTEPPVKPLLEGRGS